MSYITYDVLTILIKHKELWGGTIDVIDWINSDVVITWNIPNNKSNWFSFPFGELTQEQKGLLKMTFGIALFMIYITFSYPL